MPTVLVTGYGGFLGHAVAAQLLDAGYTVRGLARGMYPALVGRGLQPMVGPIESVETAKAVVRNCDAIVHTAAKAGVWGPWREYYQNNTAGTSSLIEAAVSAGCQAFVFTSSPSVTFTGSHQSGIDETAAYPKRWLCHYPHTKALAEMQVLQAARNGVISACSLRPHLIWGDGDPHLMPRVVQRARAGKLKRVGAGSNRIDIVHVDNAARAHVLALERLLAGDHAVNGEAFFITDGEPIGCWDWITRILQTAGVQVPAGSIGYRAAYRIGGLLETIYFLARIRSEPRMTRFVAAQLAMDHYFSINKARRLLGYRPQPKLESGLEQCRPWLRSIALS